MARRFWAASLVVAVLALACTSASAIAAPGDPDPTFSGDGYLFTPNSAVNDVLVGGNDKVLAVGRLGSMPYDPNSDFMVARYNADGQPDDSFNGDGVVTTNLGNRDEAWAAARQSDGKIVVVGCSYHSDGSEDFVLARYTSKGVLDDSFSGDGIVDVPIATSRICDPQVAVTPKDRIIVTESTGFGGSHPQPLLLARYRNDGTLDPGFSSDGEKTVPIPGLFGGGIAVEASGKIVIAGTSYRFPNSQPEYRWTVVRLAPSGPLDRSFSNDGIARPRFGSCVYAQGDSVALQAKGKVVTGGSVRDCGSMGDDFALARYRRDGRLDRSFAGDGRQTTDFTSAMRGTTYCCVDDSLDGSSGLAVRPRGKIVLAGHSDVSGGEGFGPAILSRYRYDGRLDHSFSGDGRVVTDRDCFGWTAAAIRDAKVVVGGHTAGCHFSLTPSGAPDDAGLARFDG